MVTAIFLALCLKTDNILYILIHKVYLYVYILFYASHLQQGPRLLQRVPFGWSSFQPLTSPVPRRKVLRNSVLPVCVINPLTTSAESNSDSAEIFTSDSSYFLKNKRFLHEFVSFCGLKEFYVFFLFLTVWTYFSSNFVEYFLGDST